MATSRGLGCFWEGISQIIPRNALTSAKARTSPRICSILTKEAMAWAAVAMNTLLLTEVHDIIRPQEQVLNRPDKMMVKRVGLS